MARSSLIPGFRFHPTDVELVMYYLKKKLMGKKICVDVVAEVNIYEFSPWDLPDKSSLKSGDLEWYFFCPKSKKYSSGGRANRATESGFWKGTGKDRKVEYKGRIVGTINTLIFHLGNAKDWKRTNWVMHEYRMEDKELADGDAGIVQDAYALCRIFEKSGSGPKNGAQYGAPFCEEEWDDDLASCSDSLAIVGSFGVSNSTDHKQKGPATTSMTGPGSSVVTFSANEPTSTTNYKQNGPVTTNMDEPGSSKITFSASEPSTNTLNDKQKGPATTNMTEPGSSNVSFSANEPTNTPTCKQKGLATMDMIEPGSSMVMFSADELTSTLNYKQKGPATMNMPVPKNTHADVICLEDIDQIPMGVPEGVNEGDGSNDDNLFNPDDLIIDGPSYTFDDLMEGDPTFEGSIGTFDDYLFNLDDLGNFY